MTKKAWPVIVLSPSLPEGRSAAQLYIEKDAFHLHLPSQEIWKMPYQQLKIQWAGTGKNTLQIQSQLCDFTVSIREKSFLKSLQKIHSPHLQNAAKSLHLKRKLSLLWILTGGAILLLLAFLTLYFLFPLMANQLVQTIPPSVDVKLGEAAFPSSIQQFAGPKGECKNPTVVHALQLILKRLLNALENNPYEFEMKILWSNIPNAFALPGGKIVVLTELIKMANTPEEVAGVLAHEISHVTQRHGLRHILRQLGVVLTLHLLLGDTSALTDLVVSGSTKLIGLKFSREMEKEADYHGFLLMKKAGLHPKGLRDFFEKLSQKHNPQIPEWISTHPGPENRVQFLNQLLQQQMKNFQPKPLPIRWKQVQQALQSNP